MNFVCSACTSIVLVFTNFASTNDQSEIALTIGRAQELYVFRKQSSRSFSSVLGFVSLFAKLELGFLERCAFFNGFSFFFCASKFCLWEDLTGPNTWRANERPKLSQKKEISIFHRESKTSYRVLKPKNTYLCFPTPFLQILIFRVPGIRLQYRVANSLRNPPL